MTPHQPIELGGNVRTIGDNTISGVVSIFLLKKYDKIADKKL